MKNIFLHPRCHSLLTTGIIVCDICANMKNNEHFNSKLSEARERRAKSLLRLFNKGWSVKRLADREGVTTSRIYSLLAGVKNGR